MAITHVGGNSNSSGLGAVRTADLSTFNDGDIVFAIARNATANSITNPSGWTQIGSHINTVNRTVSYRVKQSGDTTFDWTFGGSGTTSLAWDGFSGADYGEISSPTNAATNSTNIPVDALTVAATSASLILASHAGAGTTGTPPTGFAELQDGVGVYTCWDSTLSSGSYDPDDVVLAATRGDRIAWHVELLDATATTVSHKNLSSLGVG